MIEQFIQQLNTFRTGLILQLQMTDQLIAKLSGEPIQPEGCQHPEDKRINITTMGGPRSWLCKLCDYEHREAE